MQDINALFLPTLVSGVTWWRMFNPVTASLRKNLFKGWLMWWQKDLNEIHPWQIDINDNRYRARITGEIDSNCKRADVVIMGMIHSHTGLVTMQGIRECYGKPVVMEIDDNILSCPTYNPAAVAYNPDTDVRKNTIKQMKEADAMVVSTPYLKDVFSEFNDNIYVIPNAIDFDIWGKVQHKKHKGKITIGWIGGATHNDDLLIIKPAIEYITKKYKNVQFVFGHGMHPDFKDMKGVKWVKKFAAIDKYPALVGSLGMDIGIAPLVDNAFNRGKSNLRWLEYSSLGIPCVASNVGHFAQTITHGEDGLLADTTEDFIKHLESLINDKHLRKEIGRAALCKVYEDFNIDKVTARYRDVLQEIIERGQITKVKVAKESNHIQEAEII